MLNESEETNLYSYYTPKKHEGQTSKKGNVCGVLTAATSITTACESNFVGKNEDEEGENQMTQQLLTFRTIEQEKQSDVCCQKLLFSNEQEEQEVDEKIRTHKLIKGISKKRSAVGCEIRRFDSVRSLLLDGETRGLSDRVSNLVAEIRRKKNAEPEGSRACSPARNVKVNAILNRSSLKDRYRSLLGSKVVELKTTQNKEMFGLMTRVESIVSEAKNVFLSSLISMIGGLTILKMNAIMQVQPNLYQLCLQQNEKGQQDLLIQLPQNENVADLKQFREQRIAQYKQCLYYLEKDHEIAQCSTSSLNQNKLTSTILQSLQNKQNQLIHQATQEQQNNNPPMQTLNSQSQINQTTNTKRNTNSPLIEQHNSVPFERVAQIVKDYFEARNVSNIFQINLVEQIGKQANISLPLAELQLGQLVTQYPSWLSQVKSSLLGPIIRINYQMCPI